MKLFGRTSSNWSADLSEDLSYAPHKRRKILQGRVCHSRLKKCFSINIAEKVHIIEAESRHMRQKENRTKGNCNVREVCAILYFSRGRMAGGGLASSFAPASLSWPSTARRRRCRIIRAPSLSLSLVATLTASLQTLLASLPIYTIWESTALIDPISDTKSSS